MSIWRCVPPAVACPWTQRQLAYLLQEPSLFCMFRLHLAGCLVVWTLRFTLQDSLGATHPGVDTHAVDNLLTRSLWPQHRPSVAGMQAGLQLGVLPT